ncbi:MAG: hypothetical protein OEY58_21655, partial [Gammaproteobacteria bacterium]|nr:hypothetical protein [Gammaproteobacteria bacterium]
MKNLWESILLAAGVTVVCGGVLLYWSSKYENNQYQLERTWGQALAQSLAISLSEKTANKDKVDTTELNQFLKEIVQTNPYLQFAYLETQGHEIIAQSSPQVRHSTVAGDSGQVLQRPVEWVAARVVIPTNSRTHLKLGYVSGFIARGEPRNGTDTLLLITAIITIFVTVLFWSYTL